jgi:5'-nucleotidase
MENIKLHIYSVNDFHGEIESLVWKDKSDDSVLNNTGVKLFSFLKKVREENENAIILSVGDMFQVQPKISKDFNTLTSLLVREVGFDGMAIGNHEFDCLANTEDYFSKLASIVECPLICCNLYHGSVDKKASGIVTSKIINVSNIKLGLIGVVTPQCVDLCTKEELGDYIINHAKDDIKIEILKLKSLGVNSIVLLAHMDIYYSEESNKIEGELLDILSEFDNTDIKLVLSGHSHQYINENINGIPVVQAGAYGEALSYSKISFDHMTNHAKIDKLEIIKISELNNFEIHPKIKEITLRYLDENYVEKQLITNLPLDMVPSNIHNTAWMSYVVEFIREYTLADIAIINHKFFRKPLPTVEIYDQDILANIPFRNSLFSMKVSGDLLLEIFNNYGNDILRGAIFSEFSLKDIIIDKEYTLATTDFIADGGDSFTLLKRGTQRNKHNIIIQDIIMDRLLN